MELLKQQRSYQEDNLTDTPYLKGIKEWDSRMGQPIKAASNWRTMAFLLAMILMASVAMNFSQYQQRSVEPYYVEYDQSGNVLFIGKIRQGNFSDNEGIIGKNLRDIIRWVRSLPSDIVVARGNWKDAYAHLSPAAATKMNTLNQTNNPFEHIGVRTRQIVFNSVLPTGTGKNTYQIQWTEITSDMSGTELFRLTYTGLFSFYFEKPKTKKDIYNNPLGFWVDEFQWKENL